MSSTPVRAGTAIIIIGVAGVVVSIDDLTATGTNRTAMNKLINKALGEVRGDKTTNTIKVLINGVGAATSIGGVYTNGKAVINGSEDIGKVIIDALNAGKDTDGAIQSYKNLNNNDKQ